MSTVIKVDNLGKKYTLTHQQREPYTALRDVITTKVKTAFRKSAAMLSTKTSHLTPDATREEFWALKDVSFEVKQGDRVGIIGRNGAGKSTLLKILSRITEPTVGRVSIKGRVASLLEVGTGFHPELTGRENIFLNGAVLGMTRVEIKKKFDEIVDFAEVEKFLDTPVKRYSSGMYVRLAFAVAAHLEPEILVVDEVLAVGDAQFQKKCLGKMEDVSLREGRTVLFVSHNMASVQHLCKMGIFLQTGNVKKTGEIADVISAFMSENGSNNDGIIDAGNRLGNGLVRFLKYRCLDRNRRPVVAFRSGEHAILEISIEMRGLISAEKLHISVGIDDVFGVRITHLSSDYASFNDSSSADGIRSVLITIPNLPLCEGKYFFTLFSKVGEDVCDWVQKAGWFDVETGDFFKNGKVIPKGQGIFFVEHNFELI